MPSRPVASPGSGARSPNGTAKRTRPVQKVVPEPAALTTNELPVTVIPPHSQHLTGGTFEDDWYRPKPRRRPAPVAVQFVVWVLFFALLIAILSLSVVYVHPTWVSFLRNTTSEKQAPTSPGVTKTKTAPAPVFGLESETAKGANYIVPDASYTIVVTTNHQCWVGVKSPANATSYVFDKTLVPPADQASISVKGSSSVLTGSSAVSIEILANKKSVGEISRPKSGFTYSFLPPSS